MVFGDKHVTNLNLFEQENLQLFQADKDSEMWHNYISHVDEMVIEGFFNCIFCSLNYFVENMEVIY